MSAPIVSEDPLHLVGCFLWLILYMSRTCLLVLALAGEQKRLASKEDSLLPPPPLGEQPLSRSVGGGTLFSLLSQQRRARLVIK